MRIATFEQTALRDLAGEGRLEAIKADLGISRFGVDRIVSQKLDTGKRVLVTISQGEYDDDE